MDHNISRKERYEQLSPRDIPRDYYDFSFYVSKERMLTYWHQANEILGKSPKKILEVGMGNGIVTSILKCYGIAAVKADINESLQPDVVVSITELDRCFEEGEFPFTLCARVLQHLPFSEFERALSQLRFVTQKYVLLTLPVETCRFYTRFRITGSKPFTLSIGFPLVLKRFLQRILRITENSQKQNFWKINQSRQQSMANVRRIIEKHFLVEKAYQVPEDMAHAFFVLRKK